MVQCETTCCVILGSVLSAVSILFIFTTILCFLVFTLDDQFRTFPGYRLAAHLAIYDIIQLIVNFMNGLAVVLQWEMPFLLSKILGALLYAGWFASLFVIFISILNRFQTIILWKYVMNAKVPLVSHILCILVFLFVFCVKLLPDNNYTQNLSQMKFDAPQSDGWLSQILVYISNYGLIFDVVVGVVVYALIISKIVIKRARFSIVERSITSQTAIVLSFYSISFVFWTFFFPNIRSESVLFPFFSQFLWITANGMQSVILPAMNRRVRHAILRLFHIPPNDRRKSAKSTRVNTIAPISKVAKY